MSTSSNSNVLSSSWNTFAHAPSLLLPRPDVNAHRKSKKDLRRKASNSRRDREDFVVQEDWELYSFSESFTSLSSAGLGSRVGHSNSGIPVNLTEGLDRSQNISSRSKSIKSFKSLRSLSTRSWTGRKRKNSNSKGKGRIPSSPPKIKPLDFEGDNSMLLMEDMLEVLRRRKSTSSGKQKEKDDRGSGGRNCDSGASPRRSTSSGKRFRKNRDSWDKERYRVGAVGSRRSNNGGRRLSSSSNGRRSPRQSAYHDLHPSSSNAIPGPHQYSTQAEQTHMLGAASAISLPNKIEDDDRPRSRSAHSRVGQSTGATRAGPVCVHVGHAHEQVDEEGRRGSKNTSVGEDASRPHAWREGRDIYRQRELDDDEDDDIYCDQQPDNNRRPQIAYSISSLRNVTAAASRLDNITHDEGHHLAGLSSSPSTVTSPYTPQYPQSSSPTFSASPSPTNSQFDQFATYPAHHYQHHQHSHTDSASTITPNSVRFRGTATGTPPSPLTPNSHSSTSPVALTSLFSRSTTTATGTATPAGSASNSNEPTYNTRGLITLTNPIAKAGPVVVTTESTTSTSSAPITNSNLKARFTKGPSPSPSSPAAQVSGPTSIQRFSSLFSGSVSRSQEPLSYLYSASSSTAASSSKAPPRSILKRANTHQQKKSSPPVSLNFMARSSQAQIFSSQEGVEMALADPTLTSPGFLAPPPFDMHPNHNHNVNVKTERSASTSSLLLRTFSLRNGPGVSSGGVGGGGERSKGTFEPTSSLASTLNSGHHDDRVSEYDQGQGPSTSATTSVSGARGREASISTTSTSTVIADNYNNGTTENQNSDYKARPSYPLASSSTTNGRLNHRHNYSDESEALSNSNRKNGINHYYHLHPAPSNPWVEVAAQSPFPSTSTSATVSYEASSSSQSHPMSTDTHSSSVQSHTAHPNLDRSTSTSTSRSHSGKASLHPHPSASSSSSSSSFARWRRWRSRGDSVMGTGGLSSRTSLDEGPVLSDTEKDGKQVVGQETTTEPNPEDEFSTSAGIKLTKSKTRDRHSLAKRPATPSGGPAARRAEHHSRASSWGEGALALLVGGFDKKDKGKEKDDMASEGLDIGSGLGETDMDMEQEKTKIVQTKRAKFMLGSDSDLELPLNPSTNSLLKMGKGKEKILPVLPVAALAPLDTSTRASINLNGSLSAGASVGVSTSLSTSNAMSSTSPSWARPALLRRDAHVFPDAPAGRRRWTLANALTDEGISDAGLIQELERMRELGEWEKEREREQRRQRRSGRARKRPLSAEGAEDEEKEEEFEEDSDEEAGVSEDNEEDGDDSGLDVLSWDMDTEVWDGPLSASTIGARSQPSYAPKRSSSTFTTSPPSPAWLATQRALLICRELILTERHYLSLLNALLRCETATPPPALMLRYAETLVRASEGMLRRMEREPSVGGVARAFLEREEEMSNAFVAWCGVVGGWFFDGQDRSSKRGRRKRIDSKDKEGSVTSHGHGIEDTQTDDGHGSVRRGTSALGHDSGPSAVAYSSGPSASSTTATTSPPISPLKRTVSQWRRSMPSVAGLAMGIDGGVMSIYGSHKEKDKNSSRTRESSTVSLAPPVLPLPVGLGGAGLSMTFVSEPATAPTISSATTTPIAKSSHTQGQTPTPTQSKTRKPPPVRELAILPTQRVMRYVLLYRDLLAHTPHTSVSRIFVERAVDAACRIADKCDRAQGNAAFITGSSSPSGKGKEKDKSKLSKDKKEKEKEKSKSNTPSRKPSRMVVDTTLAQIKVPRSTIADTIVTSPDAGTSGSGTTSRSSSQRDGSTSASASTSATSRRSGEGELTTEKLDPASFNGVDLKSSIVSLPPPSTSNKTFPSSDTSLSRMQTSPVSYDVPPAAASATTVATITAVPAPTTPTTTTTHAQLSTTEIVQMNGSRRRLSMSLRAGVVGLWSSRFQR